MKSNTIKATILPKFKYAYQFPMSNELIFAETEGCDKSCLLHN